MIYIKTVKNFFSSIKTSVKDSPSIFKNYLISLWNYFEETKYRLRNISQSNIELGLYHLYKNNLTDAILRFKLVDNFFSPGNAEANYWLGWTYLLKGNRDKALFYLKKSELPEARALNDFLISNTHEISRTFAATQVSAGNEMQAKLASGEDMQGAYVTQDRSVLLVREDPSNGATKQIPAEVEFRVWRQYRDLVSQYYMDKFYDNDNHLPYIFSKMLSKNVELPNEYRVLEIGSNIGLLGYEVRKILPGTMHLTSIECSPKMQAVLEQFYVKDEIYNEIITSSHSPMDLPNSRYTVIISLCGLSFSNNLEQSLLSIYNILINGGYFGLCIAASDVTHLPENSLEFIYNANEMKEQIKSTNFELLDSCKLSLGKNNNYYIFIYKKLDR